MKKILLILTILISTTTFAQLPPAVQPDGIKTPLIDPIGKTNTELNAMTNIPEGRKAYSTTDSEWKVWDGDSWETFGGGGSIDQSAAYTWTGAHNFNSTISVNGTGIPNLNVNNTSNFRSAALYSDFLNFSRDGFSLNIGTTTLTANTTFNFPAKAAGTYTLATLEDIVGGSADNLGNHTATQNIDIGSFLITENGTDGLSIDGDLAVFNGGNGFASNNYLRVRNDNSLTNYGSIIGTNLSGRSDWYLPNVGWGGTTNYFAFSVAGVKAGADGNVPLTVGDVNQSSANTFTETQTFDTGTTDPNIISNNSTASDGIELYNTGAGSNLYASNNSASASSSGMWVYNQNLGKGFDISNIGAGTGQVITNGNSSTGNALEINGLLTSTGLLYVGKNNGSNTFTVDKLGNIVGNTINGVALTTGNSASNFLNGEGNYVPISGGGSSNPNKVIVDDESDFVGTDKEFWISADFTLTQNLNLPSGARLVDGGGVMTVSTFDINGTDISFHSAYNRTFIDLGANGTINDNATFANHSINLSWFGFVFDGDEVAGTGTDNRNCFLQTLKIINKIGGNHVFISDGTGTENVSYSLVDFTQSYTSPSNFYISGNVSLYLGQGVKITALPNALDTYDVMSIWNPDDARIWGPGEIVGEVRNHTFSGNDEGCHGVIVYGYGEKASVEVKIRNVSGDGVIQRGNPLYTSVGGLEEANFTKDFFIEENGTTTADSNYAYSILFDITGTIQTWGHFRLAGQGFSGYFGLDVQKFYVAYYDASDVFIERTGLLDTYRDIEVKPEYKKMRIIIHTPSVWGDLDGSIVTLITPKRVKISSPLITYGVRQGISNLGAFGEISGIKFYKIGRRFDGTPGSPAYAIDLEDGYQGNTNVWIHGNIFDKCYNGFITLIAPTNAIIENNYFMRSDDPDYPGNGISSWKGEGTIFRFNTQYGTSVSLGRDSQSHNNMSYDVKWLIHKDNEVIRDETQNFNPKYVYSIVNVGSDYAYIKDTYNTYNKPNASSDYIFYFRNQSDVVWERNTFDFTEAPAFDNSSNRLTSVTNGQHTTPSRGFVNYMKIINLYRTSHTEGLQWVVQPIKNWSSPTIGLDIRAGLTADFESENVEVPWLNLELNDYPATDGGDATLYNTLTYKDLKIKPADDTYLSTVRYALFAENKDVNLVFDGGYIDLQFGNVYDGQLLFNFEHYGTTTFKNFKFSTNRPNTTLNLDTLIDGEPAVFIDCEFSSDITVNLGSNGHKLLYTKPHDRCPTYADNATAVAALGVGYYYKDSSNSNKFEITY